MTDRILCVDDDPNILAGYSRALRKQLPIETALGPEVALDLIAKHQYAVLVTDMNMPVMNGIELLTRVKELQPHCVRMMLTGNADLKTAIDAVHRGNVFRFLVKPFPAESLAPALEAALDQYRLITAEQDLLEKTLRGSIRVLIEILSLIAPESFGRATALKQSVRTLADGINLPDVWKLELGAMLCSIGLVTLPPGLSQKAKSDKGLNEQELKIMERVPEISHNLLINIPRLEPVAKIILYQAKNYDGTGFPADSVSGCQIPLGARVLKVLIDLAQFEQGGLSKVAALMAMKRRQGVYDPQILQGAISCFALIRDQQAAVKKHVIHCSVNELRLGYILASDVETDDGTLLISSGHRITETLLEKIKNFVEVVGVKEPLLIEEPDEERTKLAA